MGKVKEAETIDAGTEGERWIQDNCFHITWICDIWKIISLIHANVNCECGPIFVRVLIWTSLACFLMLFVNFDAAMLSLIPVVNIKININEV